MKEWVAYSETDLPHIAKSVLEQLGHAKVLAFDGEMGAGKTTFIVTLLRAMGVEHPEGSPTYGIMRSYESAHYGEVHHFDVYRLESVQEALDAGLEEFLYGGEYCFIEWPSKIEALLPDDTMKISIQVNDQLERIFSMNNYF